MRRAFLDACALYPPLVRGLLLSAAAEGLFAPAWSPRVLEEWARAAGRDHGPAAAEAARAEAAAMDARWPDARTPHASEAEAAISLPDPADAHVLAAALAARAELLVTFNLRDFPAPKLRALGLAPIGPDAFLWEMAGPEPAAMGRALRRALEAFPAAETPAEVARLLRKADLPRLRKLLRTGGLSAAP